MQALVEQLIIGLSIGATYALIALGYTMVYGVLRLINFAHGEIYMVGGISAYYLALLMIRQDAPPWVDLLGLGIGQLVAHDQADHLGGDAQTPAYFRFVTADQQAPW